MGRKLSILDRILRRLGLPAKPQPGNVTTFGGAEFDSSTKTISLARDEADAVDVIGGVALFWFDNLRASPEWSGTIEKHYGTARGTIEEQGRQRFVRHFLAYMEERGSRPEGRP